MKFERQFTGAPWEKKVGYCRAIRVGSIIHVSGTVPVGNDGSTYRPDSPYLQAKRCLEIIDQTLVNMGSGLSHVFRTRMFVTDISRWEEFGRAHAEVFGSHPPATSMV